DSLNTMFTAYQKVETTLSAAQKETRQKAMRDLQTQLQDRQQQLAQQAQARQNELMAPIMEQVKKVLDDIRTEDGYSMIITGDPQLILSSDKNRSEEHTSELQSRSELVCRLLLEKKKIVIFSHSWFLKPQEHI